MTTRPEAEASLLRLMAKFIFSAMMICALDYPLITGDVRSPTVACAIKTYGSLPVLIAGIVTPLLLISAFWFRRMRFVGGLAYALVCGAVAEPAFKSSPSMSILWLVFAFGGICLAATGVRRG